MIEIARNKGKERRGEGEKERRREGEKEKRREGEKEKERNREEEKEPTLKQGIKRTNLATLGVRGEEVNDLDTSLENGGPDVHFREGRGLGVDGEVGIRLDGATLVNWLTNDVHDAAKGGETGGDGDGITGVNDGLAANETLGTVHGNGADGVLTEMLGNLEDEAGIVVLDLKGVEDGGQAAVLKLDIDDGTNDRHNAARGVLLGGKGAHCAVNH